MQPVTGRDVSAILNPRPVVIVGACDEEGHVSFATVIWATPVSHNPAMAVFALRGRSKTLQTLQQAGWCSIATLPATSEGVRITELCGNKSGHAVDKGLLVEHAVVSLAAAAEPSACSESPQRTQRETALFPVLAIASSWMACRVEDIRETGDHLLVTVAVEHASSTAQRDEKGRLAPSGIDTLLCVQHDAFTQGLPLHGR